MGKERVQKGREGNGRGVRGGHTAQITDVSLCMRDITNPLPWPLGRGPWKRSLREQTCWEVGGGLRWSTEIVKGG